MLLVTPNKVLVLSNDPPDKNLLSLDRWVIYKLLDGKLQLKFPKVEDPINPITDFIQHHQAKPSSHREQSELITKSVPGQRGTQAAGRAPMAQGLTLSCALHKSE